VGEIDEVRTGDGAIVCRDGFAATTFTPADLEQLGRDAGCPATITEVDGSSVFLELRP
jgi:2-polyprenyl-6-hydroxyphenyl methylase/3-demethylubiquinone-9 3-methyltransferase